MGIENQLSTGSPCRCIDMLLNFTNDEPRSLGLERHICRLTLHCKDLVRLKVVFPFSALTVQIFDILKPLISDAT
jgi:hypothetical protein